LAMKFNAHLSAARDHVEAESRLAGIGTDAEGIGHMAARMRHYCVKLESVPVAAALTLKRELLALGGEAAISGEAYAQRDERTDVILMGRLDQLRALSRGLGGADDGLDELASQLPGFLDGLERTRFVVPTPGGELVVGARPLLMGVINCTPDSFYDGGRYAEVEAAVVRGKELLAAGADVLDVGGESTRPGADPVSEAEEIERVAPVIEQLAAGGALVSVDTRKAGVAKAALTAGAAIINDVSALADPRMARVAADSGAALALMHMKGTPETMQADPRYDDLLGEVIEFLRERMALALAAGVSEDAIIVDPGIGFGKTVAHNLELIRDLWRLRSLGRPILLGPSNKSFIGMTLGVEADERAEGTAAALATGIMSGAQILRVHDVAGMKRFVDMAWAIKYGREQDQVEE